MCKDRRHNSNVKYEYKCNCGGRFFLLPSSLLMVIDIIIYTVLSVGVRSMNNYNLPIPKAILTGLIVFAYLIHNAAYSGEDEHRFRLNVNT